MRGLARRRKNNLSVFSQDNFKTIGISRKKMPYWQKLAIQLSICLVVALIAVNIAGSKSAVGKKLNGYFRYLMTEEVNYKPIFEQVVEVTSKARNFEWPTLDGGYRPPAVTVSSVGKGMMSIPISGKIVHSFGWINSDIDSAPRFHEGIDIAATLNSEVKAALAGKVVKVGENKELGKYLIIDHGKNIKTLYGNLSNEKVKIGDTVKAGQVIGTVGNPTESDTPSLHFEVREKDKMIDPMDMLKTEKR